MSETRRYRSSSGNVHTRRSVQAAANRGELPSAHHIAHKPNYYYDAEHLLALSIKEERLRQQKANRKTPLLTTPNRSYQSSGNNAGSNLGLDVSDAADVVLSFVRSGQGRGSPSRKRAELQQRKEELVEELSNFPFHNYVGITDYVVRRPQFQYQPVSRKTVPPTAARNRQTPTPPISFPSTSVGKRLRTQSRSQSRRRDQQSLPQPQSQPQRPRRPPSSESDRPPATATYRYTHRFPTEDGGSRPLSSHQHHQQEQQVDVPMSASSSHDATEVFFDEDLDPLRHFLFRGRARVPTRQQQQQPKSRFADARGIDAPRPVERSCRHCGRSFDDNENSDDDDDDDEANGSDNDEEDVENDEYVSYNTGADNGVAAHHATQTSAESGGSHSSVPLSEVLQLLCVVLPPPSGYATDPNAVQPQMEVRVQRQTVLEMKNRYRRCECCSIPLWQQQMREAQRARAKNTTRRSPSRDKKPSVDPEYVLRTMREMYTYLKRSGSPVTPHWFLKTVLDELRPIGVTKAQLQHLVYSLLPAQMFAPHSSPPQTSGKPSRPAVSKPAREAPAHLQHHAAMRIPPQHQLESEDNQGATAVEEAAPPSEQESHSTTLVTESKDHSSSSSSDNIGNQDVGKESSVNSSDNDKKREEDDDDEEDDLPSAVEQNSLRDSVPVSPPVSAKGEKVRASANDKGDREQKALRVHQAVQEAFLLGQQGSYIANEHYNRREIEQLEFTNFMALEMAALLSEESFDRAAVVNEELGERCDAVQYTFFNTAAFLMEREEETSRELLFYEAIDTLTGYCNQFSDWIAEYVRVEKLQAVLDAGIQGICEGEAEERAIIEADYTEATESIWALLVSDTHALLQRERAEKLRIQYENKLITLFSNEEAERATIVGDWFAALKNIAVFENDEREERVAREAQARSLAEERESARRVGEFQRFTTHLREEEAYERVQLEVSAARAFQSLREEASFLQEDLRASLMRKQLRVELTLSMLRALSESETFARFRIASQESAMFAEHTSLIDTEMRAYERRRRRREEWLRYSVGELIQSEAGLREMIYASEHHQLWDVVSLWVVRSEMRAREEILRLEADERHTVSMEWMRVLQEIQRSEELASREVFTTSTIRLLQDEAVRRQEVMQDESSAWQTFTTAAWSAINGTAKITALPSDECDERMRLVEDMCVSLWKLHHDYELETVRSSESICRRDLDTVALRGLAELHAELESSLAEARASAVIAVRHMLELTDCECAARDAIAKEEKQAYAQVRMSLECCQLVEAEQRARDAVIGDEARGFVALCSSFESASLMDAEDRARDALTHEEEKAISEMRQSLLTFLRAARSTGDVATLLSEETEKRTVLESGEQNAVNDITDAMHAALAGTHKTDETIRHLCEEESGVRSAVDSGEAAERESLKEQMMRQHTLLRIKQDSKAGFLKSGSETSDSAESSSSSSSSTSSSASDLSASSSSADSGKMAYGKGSPNMAKPLRSHDGRPPRPHAPLLVEPLPDGVEEDVIAEEEAAREAIVAEAAESFEQISVLNTTSIDEIKSFLRRIEETRALFVNIIAATVNQEEKQRKALMTEEQKAYFSLSTRMASSRNTIERGRTLRLEEEKRRVAIEKTETTIRLQLYRFMLEYEESFLRDEEDYAEQVERRSIALYIVDTAPESMELVNAKEMLQQTPTPPRGASLGAAAAGEDDLEPPPPPPFGPVPTVNRGKPAPSSGAQPTKTPVPVPSPPTAATANNATTTAAASTSTATAKRSGAAPRKGNKRSFHMVRMDEVSSDDWEEMEESEDDTSTWGSSIKVLKRTKEVHAVKVPKAAKVIRPDEWTSDEVMDTVSEISSVAPALPPGVKRRKQQRPHRMPPMQTDCVDDDAVGEIEEPAALAKGALQEVRPRNSVGDNRPFVSPTSPAVGNSLELDNDEEADSEDSDGGEVEVGASDSGKLYSPEQMRFIHQDQGGAKRNFTPPFLKRFLRRSSSSPENVADESSSDYEDDGSGSETSDHHALNTRDMNSMGSSMDSDDLRNANVVAHKQIPLL